MAKYVPHRTRPIALEFRSLCYQLLHLALEATKDATWFLGRCNNTLPGTMSTDGYPLTLEDLQLYDDMSTACQRASDCISPIQSRLDHLGQCLMVELGGTRSVYMAVLRFLQRLSCKALGGRASLVADIPGLIHTIKVHMREIVDLLCELKIRITYFRSAFSNFWWVEHEPRRQSYLDAFLTVRMAGNTHLFEIITLLSYPL